MYVVQILTYKDFVMKGFILLVLISFPLISIAEPLKFNSAKTKLRTDVYYDVPDTFYCSCQFAFTDNDNDGNKDENTIYPTSCGYTPRKPITSSGNPNKRAVRIEWEHVVPAEQFGGHRDCWKKNGSLSARDNCRRNDSVFALAEGDMHNLTAAVGELNGDRSNRRFGQVQGEPRVYGSCDFEINYDTDLVEPKDSVKGDIARIYLYMMLHHEAQVSPKKLAMFNEWDVLDPVSPRECVIDERISKVQGNHNPFVWEHCLK